MNDLDWKRVAKLAGEHGIRYRTNTALVAFLTDLFPEHDVARVTHSHLKPSNMTDQDWDSSAILGADNEWRNKVCATARAALATTPSPVTNEGAGR